MKYRRLRVTEEQTSEHFSRSRDYRNREIASNWRMCLGDSGREKHLGQLRTRPNVLAAQDASCSEGGPNLGRVARHREVGESFTRRTRHGMKRRRFALLVDNIMDQRS